MYADGYIRLGGSGYRLVCRIFSYHSYRQLCCAESAYDNAIKSLQIKCVGRRPYTCALCRTAYDGNLLIHVYSTCIVQRGRTHKHRVRISFYLGSSSAVPSADYRTDVHVMIPVVQILLALRYSMLSAMQLLQTVVVSQLYRSRGDDSETDVACNDMNR